MYYYPLSSISPYWKQKWSMFYDMDEKDKTKSKFMAFKRWQNIIL